jgi:hypothetical protein
VDDAGAEVSPEQRRCARVAVISPAPGAWPANHEELFEEKATPFAELLKGQPTSPHSEPLGSTSNSACHA